MKKFTRNFLFGEQGLGNVLRRVGLSMVALLFAVAVMAQEAQETYHVWANDTVQCYRYDNTYEVQISMKDFIKIDTFTLTLDYNQEDFSFLGLKTGSLHPVLDFTGTFTVADNPVTGELTMKWGSLGDPVANGTIGTTPAEQNAKTDVLVLTFSLKSYGQAYGPVNRFNFSSDLEWDELKSEFKNDQGTDITEILTDWNSDGELAVTQAMTDITMDVNAADCNGNDAIVTITTPGDSYSFNGNSFTTNASSNVTAPSMENTVRVRNGECVSYVKEFDVTAPEALAFTTEDTVYTNCPGSLGDIEIFANGGVKDYSYYVVPEADWARVTADFAISNTPEAGMLVVADYETGNIVQRTAGTVDAPEVYYVAVQDANACQDIRDTEWWMMVNVMDTLEAFVVGDTTITNVSCFGGSDGDLEVDAVVGGTPFVDGYNVFVNDVYKGRSMGYHGVNLMAGFYTVLFVDSVGCQYAEMYQVTEPDPIMFDDLTHTDAGCDMDNGSITLDNTDFLSGANGGTFAGGSAYWIIDTMEDFSSPAPVWMGSVYSGLVAENLAAHVYYAKIFDDNGCSAIYENINKDNAIKVFTYDADVVYDPILCNGGTTSVSIVITGENASHQFEYSVSGDAVVAQGTDKSWTLPEGTYTFTIYDLTSGCDFSISKTIIEPTPISLSIVDLQTLPPSCPDNTDGNLTVRAEGGTPFERVNGNGVYRYKMDNGDWVQPSAYGTFAIDLKDHWIYVEDASGCMDSVEINWEPTDNIISFEDVIHTECAEGRINLFNRYAETTQGCNPFEVIQDPDYGDNIGNGPFHFWNINGICPEGVDLDMGYLNHFEFYGRPLEHFGGVYTIDINIWTSDSGWVNRTLQGFQQLRNPVLYASEVDPAGNPASIVAEGSAVGHATSFGEGTYWLVTKDEWGCYSNIEKIQIIDPAPLAISVEKVDAGCDGATDGKIMISALNGRFTIPTNPSLPDPDSRYQYVLTQQPEIFTVDNWVNQVRWMQFDNNGDPLNDSLAVISVQAGTYWVAVRDWCGLENTGLIQFEGPIEIDGLEAIDVDWSIAKRSNVTCNIWDPVSQMAVPANDGSILDLAAATKGGSGTYTFELDYLDGVNPVYNATIDGFDMLMAGTYVLTVKDDGLGCEHMETLVITQPEVLRATVDVVNASCFDGHEGLLRYKITGGTAPYMEITENHAAGWENIADLPDERWVSVAGEGWKALSILMENDDHIDELPYSSEETNVRVFDRRVRNDQKQIWIKDAKDCIYGPINVVVEQPGKLDITEVVPVMVSCNGQSPDGVLHEGITDDGSVTFMPVGGWNLPDTLMSNPYPFEYTAELWSGSNIVATQKFDTIPDAGITYSGLPIGNYTIKLYEYSPAIAATGYAKQITTYTNYETDQATWSQFAPYQNPDLDMCFALYDFTIGEPDPITYTPKWNSVKCYNEANGSIELMNIEGGTWGTLGNTSGLNGYWVGLQGPVDYDPMDQVNVSGTETMDYVGITWFETLDTDFEFNNLPYGHYTIHIMDNNGCWIYKESGEVQNIDTLQIVVLEKHEDALCNGGFGKVEIHATGGTGEGTYSYAVDSTLVPHPGTHVFPDLVGDQAYLDALNWQDTAVFDVTAATWVAYVMDANGCVVGYSTDTAGVPIMHHRTTVTEPDLITITETSSTDVTCYGYENGEILIDGIEGGNGATWTITVSGIAANDSVVNKTYTRSASSNIVLGGLFASKTEYEIVVTDVAGCVSGVYMQVVHQPNPFVVTIEDKQNSFICPGDQGGLYEIVVVSGGVPFGTNAGGNPIYEYKWEVYEDAAHTMPVDSLSDEVWGVTTTFNGYGDLYYKVYARDAEDCETWIDTFITAPTPITFELVDITCGIENEKASASITNPWTNNRKWRVLYKEIEQEVAGEPAVFTPYDLAWNDVGSTLNMRDTFVFDIENVQDVHYVFIIEDSLGCRSEPDTMTFDYDQNGFVVSDWTETPGICETEVSYTVSGAEGQFTVTVNNMVIDTVGTGAQTLTLTEEGTNTVVIKELNGFCHFTEDVVVTPVITEIAEDFGVFVGDSIAYTNSEAGVDSLLIAGVYTFTYDSPSADACFVVLTVTVTEYDVPVAVLDTVMPGDTIETSHPVFEIVFDALTPIVFNGVDTVDYYLTVTEKDSSEASLMIPVTASMVSGNIVTIDYDGAVYGYLKMNTSYIVTVDSGAIWSYSDEVMAAGTPWDANVGTWMFTTGDSVKTDVNPIDLNVEALDFKVYPNPFNNYIKVENYDKLSRVVITNIAGQRVLDIENPEFEIRTGNLVTGVYVVTLIRDNSIVKSERIIKR